MRETELKTFKVLSGGSHQSVDVDVFDDDDNVTHQESRRKYVPDYQEINYGCTMLPATKAQMVFVELLDVLGHPLLMAVSKGFTDSSDLEGIADAGANSLFTKLRPDNSDRLIKVLLGCVRSKGAGNLASEAVFDKHFAGRIHHLYKVIAWSIEVNYRDFFVAAHSFPMLDQILRAVGQVVNQKITTQVSGESSELETH